MQDGTLSPAAALPWPRVIQGGMGVYVSGYMLARAVSRAGQLGVVSATALDQVFVRKLQLGDKDGSLQRACAAFPDRHLVKRVWDRYFVPKVADKPFRRIPGWTAQPKKHLIELAILATFCEVWLAKENHGGIVGVNLMQKLQLPTFAYLYGSLLAGVDYLLVGAGIPSQFSGFLDKLTKHEPARMRLQVNTAGTEDSTDHEMEFTPKAYLAEDMPPLKRPRFLPIVSSHVLAKHLLAKAGHIDGFIVEGPTAGGHNAPPRVSGVSNEDGEPVYGAKDACNLEEMRKLGRPFYLAGGYGSPEGLKEALAEGAAGVQVGTPFALCEESGMDPALRAKVIEGVESGDLSVLASPNFSPTGMPFQTARMEGTVATDEVYEDRTRVCDVGLLTELYQKRDGTLGTRCSAEPEDVFVMKGGDVEETKDRRCLCNGLLATAGFAQIRPRNKKGNEPVEEPPIVTLGKDLTAARHFLAEGKRRFSAAEVVAYITGAKARVSSGSSARETERIAVGSGAE